jgi:hypothetical protein
LVMGSAAKSGPGLISGLHSCILQNDYDLSCGLDRSIRGLLVEGMPINNGHYLVNILLESSSFLSG